MILLALKFTEGKLSHDKEHDIGIKLRDRLISLVCPEAKFEFGIKEGGKPFIIDSDIKFSVSHTAGLVACALATDAADVFCDVPEAESLIKNEGIYKISHIPCGTDIGFDVELVDRTKPEKRILGIADRFFNNEEKLLLDSAEDKYSTFYKIWTGKESIIKYTGVGMADIEKADTVKAAAKGEIYPITMANSGEVFEASVCVDTL